MANPMEDVTLSGAILESAEPTVQPTDGVEVTHLRRSRGNLPREAIAFLKTWLFEHRNYAYPSDDEKKSMAERFDLTVTQVSNWFINGRRRLLPDMVKADGKRPRKFTKSGRARRSKISVKAAQGELPTMCMAIPNVPVGGGPIQSTILLVPSIVMYPVLSSQYLNQSATSSDDGHIAPAACFSPRNLQVASPIDTSPKEANVPQKDEEVLTKMDILAEVASQLLQAAIDAEQQSP